LKNNKILLVSANKHAEPYPVYPLGISYIQTYLNETNPDLEIRLFDINLQQLSDLQSLLNTFDPGMIGISLRNVDDVNLYVKESFIEGYRKVVEITRKHSDGVIVLGGAGFSVFPELLFNKLKPDFGVFGEGEETLLQLVRALTDGNSYRGIDGLLYGRNNEVVFNKWKNCFDDLSLRFNDKLIDYYWQYSGMLNVQTKRGCPYNCIYCTYPLIEGSKVRTLNMEKIIDSIKVLYDQKGIDYLFFTDSVFNISNEYNYEFADRLIHSGMNIKWGGYFTIHNLDRDLLKVLKRSGLTHIEFGTESISDSVLKAYGKKFTAADVINASATCNELDIPFAHFMILGGYGESDATLDETFANSRKIENTVFFPFVGMRIYPGTILQKYAIQEKVIRADNDLLEPQYYISKNITLETLKERAKNTGKRWVFPDEDLSEVMMKMRKKNKKGPLWEYLTS
jgi:radical SAM superfamily enzyme YgiQ (UPF0313 family)